MLCEDCKAKQASIHITQTINNQTVEKYLCSTCAQAAEELQQAYEGNFSGIQDLLKGMLGQGFANIPQLKAEIPCPSCGMTYTDFSRVGKVGCCDCFNTYGDRLEPVIRRIHGCCSHKGKVPKRSGGRLAVRQRLHHLRQQLDYHVSREEYERAAVIRDEIKALEKSVQTDNGGQGDDNR